MWNIWFQLTKALAPIRVEERMALKVAARSIWSGDPREYEQNMIGSERASAALRRSMLELPAESKRELRTEDMWSIAAVAAMGSKTD